MVNSANTMLHELMRSANSYAWAWISWAWILCYLPMDYPNYGFSPLLPTMPPRSSWGCFSQPYLQGFFFLIASDFLISFIKPYLFVHSDPHLKKDFFFVQKSAFAPWKSPGKARGWEIGRGSFSGQESKDTKKGLNSPLPTRALSEAVSQCGASRGLAARTSRQVRAAWLRAEGRADTPAAPAGGGQAAAWLSLQEDSGWGPWQPGCLWCYLGALTRRRDSSWRWPSFLLWGHFLVG